MTQVALVTGGNQGLGFALVEALCHRLGPGGVVYLTARDPERGSSAVARLQAQGLAPRFERLDVTEEDGASNLARLIQARHGGIDLVISNAAARITRDRPPEAQVAGFIDTNNHGAHRMIQAFGPLLRDQARFLVVASAFGSLRNLPEGLWADFDTDITTLDSLKDRMDRYVGLVQSGRAQAEGWPDWINIPSKVAQVASMRVFAREITQNAPGRGIRVHAVCPGLVDTEASRPWFADMSSAQTPAQAAEDIVWLATLHPGTAAPHGELIQHRRVIPWK